MAIAIPGSWPPKLERLDEPHVRPIQDLVRRIRAHRGDEAVPFVDPDCGGVHARVVLLLEAPLQARSGHPPAGACPSPPAPASVGAASSG